jgi:hypothetical protein
MRLKSGLQKIIITHRIKPVTLFVILLCLVQTRSFFTMPCSKHSKIALVPTFCNWTDPSIPSISSDHDTETVAFATLLPYTSLEHHQLIPDLMLSHGPLPGITPAQTFACACPYPDCIAVPWCCKYSAPCHTR